MTHRERMRLEAFAQATRRAQADDESMVVWVRRDALDPEKDVWYVRSWPEGKPAGATFCAEVRPDGDVRDVRIGEPGVL